MVFLVTSRPTVDDSLSPESFDGLQVFQEDIDDRHWSMRNLIQRDRTGLFEEAVALGDSIRQFQIPSYIVECADEATSRNIYTRSNSSGFPMRESGVFDALDRGDSDHPI